MGGGRDRRKAEPRRRGKGGMGRGWEVNRGQKAPHRRRKEREREGKTERSRETVKGDEGRQGKVQMTTAHTTAQRKSEREKEDTKMRRSATTAGQ